MTETPDNTQVRLENTGEIDLPKFDATKYIGKTGTIVSVTEHKGIHGYYVKMTTDVLEEGGDIRASKVLGLQTIAEVNDGKPVLDGEGKPKLKIGWGPETKMGLFLKKHGVEHYNHLIGKQVIIQTRTSKEGTDFLTF